MILESQHPRPPQYDTVLKRIEKKCPQELEKIDNLLTIINEQAHDNLAYYKTTKFPGLRIPYTQMGLIISPEQKNHAFLDSPLRITEVTMDGFSSNDQAGPLAFEHLYNRAFRYMDHAKETGRTVELRILKPGQPTGLGGEVTKKYKKAGKHQGFTVDAELNRSLIQNLELDDSDLLVFNGRSMGAIKALNSALQFKDSNAQIMVDLINPPRIPGLEDKYQPGNLHIVVGYLMQGLFNKKMEKVVEEVKRPGYARELRTFFEEKGISTKETTGQKILKERVLFQNVRNIIKDTTHKREEYPFPVYSQTGAFDPINISMWGLSHVLFSRKPESVTNGYATVNFVVSTHNTDSYPVDSWSESINGVDIQPLERLQ